MQGIYEEAVKLHRGFRGVHRLLQAECRRQLPAGLERLTWAQLRMLDRLYLLECKHCRGISLRLLAESLNVTPAAACEMVDTLVQKNVVVREKDPEDRRAISIGIVPEYRKKFEETEQGLDRIFADFLADFSEERRTAALELMTQLFEFLKKRFPEEELL